MKQSTMELCKQKDKATVSQMGYRKIKRLFDVLASLILILICALPMVATAIIIWIDDPGCPVFSQWRVGLNGKKFRIYKLRTMKIETPQNVATQEMDDSDCYITRVGHYLRKLSLDEIPQLLNVLRGDMSLVGPRPLIPEEREIFQLRTDKGVYCVRPGMTGLAQINGRDNLTTEEKVLLDVQYISQLNFWTDMRILLLTIPRVIQGRDVVEGAKFRKEM